MVDTPQAWTDEELDTLRKGIALGLSSAQISRELLPNRSRNSIIGKLHRDPHLFPAKLALALSPAEKEQRRAAKAGQRVEKRTPPRKKHNVPAQIVGSIKNDPNGDLIWKDRSFPTAPKINYRDAAIPPMAGDFKALELHELQRGHCKYPHGDGPFTFCGQDVEHGKPYCPHHAALCYRTVEDRKPMKVAA